MDSWGGSLPGTVAVFGVGLLDGNFRGGLDRYGRQVCGWSA